MESRYESDLYSHLDTNHVKSSIWIVWIDWSQLKPYSLLLCRPPVFLFRESLSIQKKWFFIGRRTEIRQVFSLQNFLQNDVKVKMEKENSNDVWKIPKRKKDTQKENKAIGREEEKEKEKNRSWYVTNNFHQRRVSEISRSKQDQFKSTQTIDRHARLDDSSRRVSNGIFILSVDTENSVSINLDSIFPFLYSSIFSHLILCNCLSRDVLCSFSSPLSFLRVSWHPFFLCVSLLLIWKHWRFFDFAQFYNDLQVTINDFLKKCCNLWNIPSLPAIIYTPVRRQIINIPSYFAEFEWLFNASELNVMLKGYMTHATVIVRTNIFSDTLKSFYIFRILCHLTLWEIWIMAFRYEHTNSK